MMKMKIQICAFLTVLALCLSGVFVTSSYANILITPTRIVFEERDRFAVITLVNNGRVAKSYEISWVNLEMVEGADGYNAKDYKDGEFDLSQHIVFSPRRVTLAPGAKQRVRLALRRPESIADGDYHVHLKFRALPDVVEDVPLLEKERAEANVKINLSYTIPVVLRVGNPEYRASIGQIEMARDVNTGALKVKVPIKRLGQYSVLGWLQIYHIAGGQEELVGEISNANIFSEINDRVITVPLTREIAGGRLKAVLKYNDLSRDIVYAEKDFPLQ